MPRNISSLVADDRSSFLLVVPSIPLCCRFAVPLSVVDLLRAPIAPPCRRFRHSTPFRRSTPCRRSCSRPSIPPCRRLAPLLSGLCSPISLRSLLSSLPPCLTIEVDKVLLETPEDEIDERKLRIKDLILLAEARERMSEP